MRPSSFVILAVSMLAAASAVAQPGPPPAGEAQCRAEEAALIQDMDVARARGRMLQRRQLAEQLEAVQTRCGTRPAAQSREESIDRLQREISEMRKEIDRAETELRKLRQGL